MELCGGTHTKMTGDVGLFKIVSESSIASGIRRIEALTGFGTYLRLEEDENLINEMAHTLRAPRTELTRAVTRLLDQQRQLENELETLKRHAAKSQLDSLVETRRDVKGIPVISRKVDGVDASMLRELAESTGAKIGSGIVVLGLASNGKASLVAVVSRMIPTFRVMQDRIDGINRVLREQITGIRVVRAFVREREESHRFEKLDSALQAVYNIVADYLI